MSATNTLRQNVPEKVVSAYGLGHSTTSSDDRSNDKNIRNYAYALARNLHDTCKIVMIIASGFTRNWINVHLDDGFEEFKLLMMRKLPDEITSSAQDQVERADARLLAYDGGASSLVNKSVEIPRFMRGRLTPEVPLAVARELVVTPTTNLASLVVTEVAAARDPAQRLRVLNMLMVEQQITQGEYAGKNAKILALL